MKHPYWMVLRRCQSPLNHGFWGMSNIRGKGFTHTHIYIYIYIRIYKYIYTHIHLIYCWLVNHSFNTMKFHWKPRIFFMEEMSTPSGRGRWQHRLLQWFWRHLLRRLQLFGILHGWSRALRRPLGGKIYGKTKGTWWKTDGTSRWHEKFDGKDWEKPGEVQLRIKVNMAQPTVVQVTGGSVRSSSATSSMTMLFERFNEKLGDKLTMKWAPRERWQVVLTKATSWASSYHSVRFTTNSGDAPAI